MQRCQTSCINIGSRVLRNEVPRVKHGNIRQKYVYTYFGNIQQQLMQRYLNIRNSYPSVFPSILFLSALSLTTIQLYVLHYWGDRTVEDEMVGHVARVGQMTNACVW